MSAEQTPRETIYHGLWRENGCCEIAAEDEDGHRVGIVRHVPKSSPTGMNWGYAGSGPDDTARSLLIEVLGEDAICPVCAGTGRVVYVEDDAEGMPRAEPFDPAGTHGPGAGGYASVTRATGTFRIPGLPPSSLSTGARNGP